GSMIILWHCLCETVRFSPMKVIKKAGDAGGVRVAVRRCVLLMLLSLCKGESKLCCPNFFFYNTPSQLSFLHLRDEKGSFCGLSHSVPAVIYSKGLIDVMNKTVPSANCSEWDKVYPLPNAQKTLFSKRIAKSNFTCVNLTGHFHFPKKVPTSCCVTVLKVLELFKPLSRADVWWWCGKDKFYDRLPQNTSGFCALVSLLLPVKVYPMSAQQLLQKVSTVLPHTRRIKKCDMSWQSDGDPSYIDAIGVPRVATGFESTICWWCTINNNVDRINYIHYNIQKLANRTQSGFEAVHGQLAATFLMAFQNRIALDILLAEKGGVCAIFGEQCCTFIPNNTASDGSLTIALEGLRSLNGKMKEHSGMDTSMWVLWLDKFGKYLSLVSIAVFAAILTLCGCIRGLIQRLISTAISSPQQQSQMYLLLAADMINYNR
uniref:Uncharacterized protein n=1 Tax=Cyprinodon variegatus TaxID=28743 RepID=A0A3Q2EH29_CYPVA